jgi:hypothetical protein
MIVNRLCLTGLILFGSAMSTTGCASLGVQSEAQIAYSACTGYYNANRQSVSGGWSFVAGVNGGQNKCYWQWGSANANEASNSALAACRKEYVNCYLYATNEGWSPWAKEISDNYTRQAQARQDTNSQLTTQCKVGLFTAGLQTLTDVVAAAKGVKVPYDGSQIDPSVCKQ